MGKKIKGPKLKPCPFCGGKARLVGTGDYSEFTGDQTYYISCPTCWMRTPTFCCKSILSRIWNKRAGDDK